MKSREIAVVVILAVGLPSTLVWAQGKVSDTSPPTTAEKPSLMDEVYPGLASGVLTHARLSYLPEGILLRSGDFTVSAKSVTEEIAKAPEPLQAPLAKQALFVLEQTAAKDLLLLDAKAQAAKAGTDISGSGEQEILQTYFGKVVENIKVTDEEVAAFYRDNSEMFGEAKLDDVKPAIGRYLLQQKQEEAVTRQVRTLGQRVSIEVSAAWVKARAVSAMDNPVDKARQSGKPSLVDFGQGGCVPCDMMTPILEELRKQYEGKANVLFIHVGEEQILAARYGVRAIPVQVFFDKDGREVFRHTGFFPKSSIEKQLVEMGVK